MLWPGEKYTGIITYDLKIISIIGETDDILKELVRYNFPGLQTDELLERMIELSLYTEDHLK
ncbi:MAG: hypothetical protein OEV45_11945 [Desulfobacteraceae bacterium]|nr:hypothetical protein [Desulfobacteraceae bacterium]